MIQEEDVFINFNYTTILEDVYNILPEKIHYIHGEINEHTLLVGHDKHIKFDEKAYDEFIEGATPILVCLHKALTKDVESVIERAENIGFWEKFNWYASLNEWSKAEKIRTCYIATCYNYVNEVSVSNAILRERFGVEEKNKAIISRIIRDTLTEGLIKLEDENASPKMRRYIPYWA